MNEEDAAIRQGAGALPRAVGGNGRALGGGPGISVVTTEGNVEPPDVEVALGVAVVSPEADECAVLQAIGWRRFDESLSVGG